MNEEFERVASVLTQEAREFVREYGPDVERFEFRTMLRRAEKVAGFPVRPAPMGDLLGLVADRIRCEWDDEPLDAPVRHPDYPGMKAEWLATQDDVIRGHIVGMCPARLMAVAA